MAGANVIQEYLVSLGFDADAGELHKLDRFLGDSNHLVSSHTTGIVKSILTWQGAIVAAFNTVGLATVGIAAEVANADQQYRLLGERMFLTTDAVREIDVVTKALGATLDEIAFDPELRGRFEQLTAIADKLKLSTGPAFEADLKRIRDVQFEFQKLRVELSYIVPVSVVKLFDALGVGPDELIEKLKALNSWIQDHAPEISGEIAKDVLPIFRDWEDVMKNLFGLFEHLGTAFLNLIGILSGDRSLEGVQVSFQNVGEAIKDVSHILAGFANGVTEAADLVLHLATALERLVEAGIDLTHLDFKGALKDLKGSLSEVQSGIQDITPRSGAILGLVGGAASGGFTGAAYGSAFGPVGTVLGGAGGAILGAVGDATAGNLLGHAVNGRGVQGDSNLVDAAIRKTGVDVDYKAAFEAASQRTGVSVATLEALALTESGGSQYNANGSVKKSSAGATGILQLEPKTAAQYGLDANDPSQNIMAGAMEFARDLKRYHGDRDLAAQAYNDGAGNIDKALLGERDLPKETRDYVGRFEGNLSKTQGGDVSQSFKIDVHVSQPGASETQIAQAVVDKMKQRDNMDMLASYAQSQGVWGP